MGFLLSMGGYPWSIARAKMWRLQNAALEEKYRKLRMRYPTPVQQEIFDRVLQLATNTIPPKADLRQYWGVMGFVMNNLAEAASKDEKLTIDEKDVMAGLSKYSGLLDRVNPQRAREEDIRIDAPTGGIKSPPVGDENDTPQSSTRRVDYDLLKRIDGETRDKIIPRILPYSEFTDELIEEISGKLGVERAIVETLINYLITDPASRNELREMGYSNSQLPGWVVIIPGDKFASSTKSEKT